MENATLIGTALAAVSLALGLWAGGHALLYKRRSRSAFGWIAVCLTAPVIGAALYFFFGINRVKTLARKMLIHDNDAPATPRQPVDWAPAHLQPLGRLGEAVSALPLTEGNQVDVLHNGEAAYPAMLDAIAGARSRVFLSSYIFGGGRIGREFAEALGAATARGVDVRVIVDGVGELYTWPRVRRLLRRAGVRHSIFLPPRLLPPSFHVNLRNHRKILVVDGCVAFTGGMNIYSHCIESEVSARKRVVDVHFRMAGPIARQLEDAFLADWSFTARDDAPVPAAEPGTPGNARCRSIVDGPDSDVDRLITLLIGAIGAARDRVAIMTPYFLPPREVIGTLLAASMRGVDVAVVLPAQNNLPYIHRATRHMLWELLQRDVRIYLQPPPFVHSKLLLVDDAYALVGSANIDPRSLRLNFELNVEIYDAPLVADLKRHFEDIRSRSREITLAEVDGRRLGTRLVDGVAWLFSPYL